VLAAIIYPFYLLRAFIQNQIKKKTPRQKPGRLKNQLIQTLSGDFVNKHECRSTTVAFITSCGNCEYFACWEASTLAANLNFDVDRDAKCTVVVCDSVAKQEVELTRLG
jgi:hypothetical protein